MRVMTIANWVSGGLFALSGFQIVRLVGWWGTRTAKMEGQKEQDGVPVSRRCTVED